jgi:hypothetical protein
MSRYLLAEVIIERIIIATLALEVFVIHQNLPNWYISK